MIAERFIKRGRRYFVAMKWLVREGILRRRDLLAQVAVLSILYLGFQAAAVAVIYAFVRTVQGGPLPGPLARLGTLEGTSGELLVMTAAVIASFLAAHLAIYRARILAVDAAERFEDRCGRLALAAASRLPDLARPAANRELMETGIRQLAFTCPRYCGLIVRLIVLGIPLAVALVGALAGMTVIDAGLTAVIVLAGLTLFMPQYPANVRAAKATRRWQELRMPALRRLLDTVGDLRATGIAADADDPRLERLFGDGAVAGSRLAYAGRLKALEAGTLATQVGMILLTGAVVFWIGSRAISGAVDWALLVSYVTVLRVATSSFVGLARTTTGIARLYPQAQELTRFIQEVEKPVHDDRLLRGPWYLGVAVADKTSKKVFKFASGDRIALVAAFPGVDEPISALGAAASLKPAEAASSRSGLPGDAESISGAVARIGFSAPGDAMPLGAVLGLPSGVTAEDIKQSLSSLSAGTPFEVGACRLIEERRHEPATILGADVPSSDEMILLEMAAARLRRAPLVILKSDAVEVITRAAPVLLDRLGDGRILAVSYRSIEDLPALGERAAFICRNGALVFGVSIEPGTGEHPPKAVLSAVEQARKIRGAAGATDTETDVDE
ncbi:MAG: hypothetical protein RID91_00985 [Azospirillaceae bacterium]